LPLRLPEPTWAWIVITLIKARTTEENSLLTINGRFYVQLYCATRGRKYRKIPDRQNFPFPSVDAHFRGIGVRNRSGGM
jgi:hypothetical protein